MEKIISALLVIVGAINFYPIVGVVSARVLRGLYLIEVYDKDVLILLRHRAVMFGLLGAFIVYSAFKAELQWLAIVAALISMISFIAIAFLAGDYGAGVRKIVIADVMALILLFIAIGLRWFVRR